jgi:hypothetical protein
VTPQCAANRGPATLDTAAFFANRCSSSQLQAETKGFKDLELLTVALGAGMTSKCHSADEAGFSLGRVIPGASDA